MTSQEQDFLNLCADAVLDIHLLMNGAVKLYEEDILFARKALSKANQPRFFCALDSIGQALYLSLERTEAAFCSLNFTTGSSEKAAMELRDPASDQTRDS